MRGDPQVELQGAVLVGRRFALPAGVGDRGTIANTSTEAEMVTVAGIVLRIGSDGLTVLGPNPGVAHTVAWKRVRALEAGRRTHLEDGTPARSIDVELDDRKVKFLVPDEILSKSRLRALDEIVSAHVAPRRATDEGPRRVRDVALQSAPDIAPRNAHDVSEIIRSEKNLSEVDAGEVDERDADEMTAVAVPDKASAPESGPTEVFRTGIHRRRSSLALPPPPPRSNVAMPPGPNDPEAKTVRRSSSMKESSLVDNVLQLPLAVPPARRVELPRRLLDQSDPSSTPAGDLVDGDLVDGSHLNRAPLLPPPPPQGSWSQLPPPPAISESPDPTRTRSPDESRSTPSRVVPRQAEPGHRGEARHEPKRTRRKTVLGAGLVVVLAVSGGAIFGLSVTDQGAPPPGGTNSTLGGPSTRAASGGLPRALNGPARGADPETVAGALNIIVAGLPTGWEPGRAPWARVATNASDSALAGCLGIPLSHLGVVTGTTSTKGPRVYQSGWIASPAAGHAGFESSVVLNQTVATQESDIAALDAGGAASCLQGWMASLDVAGDAIVGVPTVEPQNVATPAGEGAAGFRISVVARPVGKSQMTIDEELIVVGAGRVEVALVGESISGPVSPYLEAFELRGIESRLRTVAAA